MILELLILIVILLMTYHWYVYKKMHYHFEKYGLKYNPGLPIFGNSYRSTLVLGHVIDEIDDVCKKFPNERYVGYMDGTRKVILVKDPELVKIITAKDYEHFMKRKIYFPKEIYPLLGSSLLQMEGEEFQLMRSLLKSAFNGSTMKQIMSIMVEKANDVVEYLKNHQDKDMKVLGLMQRYTTDVLISSLMDVRVQSVKKLENEFFGIGHSAVKFTVRRKIYYFLTMQFPTIAKTVQAVGIPLIPRYSTDFFRKVVADTIDYRKKHKVSRADYIDLMTKPPKGSINTEEKVTSNDDLSKANSNTPKEMKQWTLDQIAGQIFFGFTATFESSATKMAMFIHELALNPELQEKLYQEIKAHHDREGELNFENIMDLKYLTCFYNEVSRKWSTVILLDRVCTKTYELPPPRENGLPYKMQPGDMVYNAIDFFHMNPEYHPDPHVFNPDRFSVENKRKIKPYTFLPFGTGHRSCLGLRYENQNTKVLMYYIVLNYKVVKCAKTQDPIQLEPSQFMIRASKGTYVRFEARN